MNCITVPLEVSLGGEFPLAQSLSTGNLPDAACPVDTSQPVLRGAEVLHLLDAPLWRSFIVAQQQ
jgi:hypothetical protein